MGALIDTSVIIDLERQARSSDQAVGALLADHLETALGTEEEVALATITASELLHEVHRASPEHRPRREAFVEAVLAILATLPAMPFDLDGRPQRGIDGPMVERAPPAAPY